MSKKRVVSLMLAFVMLMTMMSYTNVHADCAHPSSTGTLVHTKYEQIDGNDDNHLQIDYYVMYCDYCNEVTNMSDERKSEKAHAFDSDNECQFCGYKISEPSNVLTAPVLHETTATVKTNEWRRYSWDEVEGADFYQIVTILGVDGRTGETVNQFCGSYVNESPCNKDGLNVFYVPGIWYLDISACVGYKAGDYVFIENTSASSRITIAVTEDEVYACDHNDYTYTDYYIDGSEPVYEDTGDGKTHLVKLKYNRTCDNCGGIIKEVLDDGKPQDHDFSNGDTCVCGYSRGACQHTHYGWIENGKGKTEKIDDETHRYTFPVIYTCTDCKATWKGTETTDAKHSMVTRFEYAVQNSTYHLVKEYSVCSSNCGMKELVRATTKEHTPGADGMCTACRYRCYDASQEEFFDGMRDIEKSVDDIWKILNSEWFLYPYEILDAYSGQHGGLTGFVNTTVFTTLNLADYLKLNGLSLDAKNHVPAIVELVGRMDDQYYADTLDDTFDFLEWLISSESVLGNIGVSKEFANQLNDMWKLVDETVINDLHMHSDFQKEYMKYLKSSIDTLQKSNSKDLKILVHRYNVANNKKMSYDKLVEGTTRIGANLNKVSDALKLVNKAVDVVSIFKDYSVNQAKLSALKECCGDNKDVMQAITYMEAYYTDWITRSLKTGEDWLMEYAIDATVQLGGKTVTGSWAAFNMGLKLSVADDLAESFMYTYSLSQISDDMKYELASELMSLKSDCSAEKIEEVRKHCHAWVDINLMASKYAVQMTADSFEQANLMELVAMNSYLHNWVDTEMDSLYDIM